MCAETAEQIAVYLNSGVVVVHIVGGWSDAVLRSLQATVSSLMAAGHFDIVLNMAAVTGFPGPEASWLDGFAALGTSLRRRCGTLDVVGTVDQIKNAMQRGAAGCWRWAFSEQEAICRVKGLPNAGFGLSSLARVRRA